jgi:uncharacterized delta-60 repeat protein
MAADCLDCRYHPTVREGLPPSIPNHRSAANAAVPSALVTPEVYMSLLNRFAISRLSARRDGIFVELPTPFRATFAVLLLLVIGVASSVFAANSGNLDISYGTAGKAITEFPNPDVAQAVAIQPDGKIVVAGGLSEFAVARYNRDGSLDTTFGVNGRAFFGLGPSNNSAHAIVIQPDGKIVVAGESGPNNPVRGIVVMRFTASGVLDTTFSGNGITSVEIPGNQSVGTGVALQPSGAVVVGGYTQIGPGAFDLVVARFTSSGDLDLSFGTQGVIQEHANARSFGNAIATSPDGKILVGGYTAVGPFNASYDDFDFLLYRYNANGTRDMSFGAAGRVIAPIGGGPDVLNALALQPDGKIITAGWVLSDDVDMAIVRFTAAGQIDNGNFGSGGKVLVDFGGTDDFANAVAIDPNGYVVAAGDVRNLSNGSQDIGLVRLESDGDLDATFGSGGKARRDIGGAAENTFGVALQPTRLHGQVTGYKIVTANFFGFFQFVSLRFHARTGPIDRATVNDFDDDGLSELAAFRPQNGNWLIAKLPPTGTVTDVTIFPWGRTGDKVVPGDYDGDGKYDEAIYRGGAWHIFTSGAVYRTYSFGLSNDIPVPSDYDGDGRTDVAVFRPSAGAWYFIASSDGTFRAASWGANGDIPVTGDFDGDDRSDFTVFRAGIWYILQSSNNQMRGVNFGLPSDKPVAFDYDNDAKTDIAVYRAGDWYIINSSTNSLSFQHWGASPDYPIPGRYGTPTGLAYVHGGQWWIQGRGIVWLTGPDGDIPGPTYFAP